MTTAPTAAGLDPKTDAVTDMDAGVHERAMEKLFPALGQVRDTAAIVAALRGASASARMGG